MGSQFLRAADVAKELNTSESSAYKIIRELNKELNKKGYLTLTGRVNRNYLYERFCYEPAEKKKGDN